MGSGGHRIALHYPDLGLGDMTMNNRLLAGFFVGVLALIMSASARATLFDRGGGMIYDDVLNITWLQDANYALTSGYPSWNGRMQFDEANAWAAQLVYGGYSDWRAPPTETGHYV